MSTLSIFVRSNSESCHLSDVDFFWGAEVPAGNLRYGKHIFLVEFNTDCEVCEFTAGNPDSNYTYGFTTVGNSNLEEPILGSNVWYCVNVNRVISVTKVDDESTYKFNCFLARARKASESAVLQAAISNTKKLANRLNGKASLSSQLKSLVAETRATVSETLAVAAEAVTVISSESSELEVEVEVKTSSISSDKPLSQQIRDVAMATRKTDAEIFSATVSAIDMAETLLSEKTEKAPERKLGLLSTSTTSNTSNNFKGATTMSTSTSISTKVSFRSANEWANARSTFINAYGSETVANGLVVACNNRGPLTKDALNTKTPFAHIAILGKALAWEQAGGLNIPVAEGQAFIVPQIEYFEGKSNCSASVIPGIAMIRAKGLDKTAEVINYFRQQGKLKSVVKNAYSLVKREQSNLSYSDKVASCLAVAIKNALPEAAKSKVLVLAHWGDYNNDRFLKINGSWNYPRYNANSSSIRSLVNAVQAEYARMGIPQSLQFVRGEELDNGDFRVSLLDEVFTVGSEAVYYEGYCRQYIQKVLMYLPIDQNLTTEDVVLMSSFDILTNIIVEFVLVHTNRESGWGQRSNGWSGFMSGADVLLTFSNARNGLRKLMQKHVPVLDLEGTVDLDPQKAHHLKSAVTPCPRFVQGTEFTAFVGDHTDRPATYLGRGGKALFNARHMSVSAGTKAASEAENSLLNACMLNDSNKGTMQPIIEVCNTLRLKVVITGNARKIASIENFACVVADLAPSLQQDFIVKVTGRLLKTDDRAAVIKYLAEKSDFASGLSGLEIESDAWWAQLISDAIIPYSTKGAKIDKRVLPALVTTNLTQSDSAMQWFGAETFVDHTVETVIAPCFNLAAPGIGYGNYVNREQFGSFYNKTTSPAEMVGVIATVECLVEDATFTAADSIEGFNTFNFNGVSVRKGQAIAKVILVDGTEVIIDSEEEGNMIQFAYRQIQKEIFGARYFETACAYKNYAYTVKLRNGIKTNVVWSNNHIFSLNKAQYTWDLLIPADAYKAADILWYQMPEIASSFSKFDAELVVAGVNPRALLLEANIAAATLLGFNTADYAVNDKLFYSPVADLYGCYDDLRNAFEVIFGQVKYLTYRNASDLYNFCVKFYSPAVEANVWRNLTESELAIICAETGLVNEFKMAIADTKDLTDKTNIILLHGDNCVSYRGWVYGSSVVEGVYCPMMHPVKVEYTTIPQSVSKSKVMFGTAVDLGSESFDFGSYVYSGGKASHDRFVMLENVVKGSQFSTEVAVETLDTYAGVEQILTDAQIQQMKSLVSTANRSVVISEFAALTVESAYKLSNCSVLVYFPLLASFGFDAANKSSVMTVAGRTYELIANLLEGKKFVDTEVANLLRSIENLLTKMIGQVEDADGNIIERRNNHRESITYGAQTVSCKIASCADITMDKFYVLKGGAVYNKMVSVFGKEVMTSGSVFVSYYRPPMTKAVAVEVIVVSKKENAKRDFPLSGDRVYGSFFAMNYNEGDQDGDGISFFYTPANFIANNEVEVATLEGMLLFIEKAIEYNQCSLEFWLKLQPYYAEQFYADHFNVKTFAEKAGKRGAQLKKSLVSWSTWNENVRGAVAQQSVFVGCSYKAQAHHTMLITILQDLAGQDWVDQATKDLIASHYGYAMDKSAKYPVQNSYELALGGFDPNMAQVGALFLLRAWSADTELPWFWYNTSLNSTFSNNQSNHGLYSIFGSAFSGTHTSVIISKDKIKTAFAELGYQEKWIMPLLNQFTLAGYTDKMNKAFNSSEDGDVNLNNLDNLCKMYPAFAVAIAVAQAVLSTSRSEKAGILEYVIANVPKEILAGFAGLTETNMVMSMQKSIKTLRNAAETGNSLDSSAISNVVRSFVSTLTTEIESTEEVEEIVTEVEVSDETQVTFDYEYDYSDEEEIEVFSAEQIAMFSSMITSEEATVKVEEEVEFFSAAQINIIQASVTPEVITEIKETKPKMVYFNNDLEVKSLEVVDTYTVTETLSSGALGSVVLTAEYGSDLLFICKDEATLRQTVAYSRPAFDRLSKCVKYTLVKTAKAIKTSEEVQNIYSEELQAVSQIFTQVEGGEFTSSDLEIVNSVLSSISNDVINGVEPTFLQVEVTEPQPVVLERLDLEEVKLSCKQVVVKPTTETTDSVVSFSFLGKGSDVVAKRYLTLEFSCNFTDTYGNRKSNSGWGALAYYMLKNPTPSQGHTLRNASGRVALSRLQSIKAEQIREDWDSIRNEVLLGICRGKANSMPQIREFLASTEDKVLLHADDEVQNELGKIWMQVRSELKAAV